MTTINLNNSSEVVVLGTIDAGNDGQQILLALIKNFDPRNYQTSDFVFSAPVALTGQDTVVDVIAATANSPATAIVRNTRIFLTPKASTGLYGPKIIYYDRIHASDLPDTTVTKGTSTTVFDVLAKLNVKTGLGIKQEDVVDGPLPAADANGMVAVPLVFKPTSLVFYGTAKINAIDYQFGGNATYIASGTVFGQYCFGTNLMRVVADGTGGANVVLFEANSAVCPLPVAGADGRPGLDGVGVLFQVGATELAHYHGASITVAQAYCLINGSVLEVVVTSQSAGDNAHTHDLTIVFDAIAHKFIVTAITNNDLNNHEAWAIGSGADGLNGVDGYNGTSPHISIIANPVNVPEGQSVIDYGVRTYSGDRWLDTLYHNDNKDNAVISVSDSLGVLAYGTFVSQHEEMMWDGFGRMRTTINIFKVIRIDFTPFSMEIGGLTGLVTLSHSAMPGTDGADGDSAYQIAINNGGAWSDQAAWLLSLKGSDGQEGPTGAVQLPPIACSDEFTPLVVADDVVAFHWGIDQTFSSVWIGLTTVQTGGEPIAVNIKVDGLSILTTPITIDNGEQTSLTAQIQPVLTTNNIAKGQRVTICITHVGNGTATGLKVYWVSDENYLPDGLSDTIVLQSGVGRTFGHIYRFGNLPNGERDYSSDGYLESSAIDSLGNVISVGGCLSHDPAYEGSYVGAITKVNSQSQLIWEKNYTISTGNEIYGEMVVVDPSDNVYVFMTHLPRVDTNDPALIGLLKLASNGDVLQQLTILTGDGVTNFNQAQVVADGILLSYQASVESVYTSTLTKIDFDGTVIWSISRSNGEEAPAFDVDADDSIYLAYGALTIPEGSPCIVEKYTSAGVLMWSNAVIITNAIASSNLYSSSVGSLGVTAQGIYVSVRGRDAFMHFDLLGNFVSAYKININNAPNGQRLLIWGMRAANNMLYISGELDGAPSGAFILQYSTITGIIECSAALQLEQVRNIYNWWSNSCVGSIDVRNGLIAVTGTSDSDGVVFLLENDIARYYGTQANQFAIDELPCTLVDVSPVFGAYAATIETLVTTTVTTPVTATLADINYYWESHYFLRPFALNVLGRVSTDHLSVGGVDLETLLARRAVTLESVTLECLVLTMADLENATNSMDETVQYYNVTTVVPSLHASWSTYNNCIELAKEGVYKVVLTCRAECLGDALTYRQWPADTAFVLGSEVSPYSSVLPEVMAVSARPHSPIPLSATQNNIEQWVDEYTFNWDGNGAGQIRPAMYSRTPNPELGLTILMKYDMSVSVTRLGHSVYVAPQS